MMEEFTAKNPNYFYDLNEFPELEILETNYTTILKELQSLLKNTQNNIWHSAFPKYVESNGENSWKTFSFLFFGIKIPTNCNLCPKTLSVLSQIPNLISADFSYLPPQTHIKPHHGFTKMVLRSHLGLIIPNNCSLRVGNQTKQWENGKILIFDDSFEHEAWNNSNEDRFVLMLDIANPKWDFTAKEICKYKIETLQDDFMLKLFPKEKWLSFLEKGELEMPENRNS